MSSEKTSSKWPYPFWIAHRGAGKLAPENTMAAFRQGASFGYRIFECDARLSADGVLVLLHDDTLDRTTSGKGLAGDLNWDELAQLDAGSWYSRQWAGEAIPTLRNVLHWCIANHYAINIEIKPTPGTEAATGKAVAKLLKKVWPQYMPAPLVSSFQAESLAAAREVTTHASYGLVLEALEEDSLKTASKLGCDVVICEHSHWSKKTIRQTHDKDLKALAYTVNDEDSAEKLIKWGIDGIITDRVDFFSPA